MKKMEQPKNPEILRQKIERAIEELAKAEGMSAEDIDSDIITFAPVEGNEEFSNPEYFEILAEQLNMRLGNILNYAQTKYAEHHSEDE
jgi:hypothetical protein